MFLPANRRNFCVSDGRSDVTDVTDICLLGLKGPGERGPGDAGIISELTEDSRCPDRGCSPWFWVELLSCYNENKQDVKMY